jgi:type VI secretion system protein ImpL
VVKPGGPVALSAPFVGFFNKAARVSAALFGGGAEPRVVLIGRGIATEQVPLVRLVHGAYEARFVRNTPPAQIVWPAPGRREARLVAQFGKREQTVAQATGEWALFRLVAQAGRPAGGGSSLRAEWPASGGRSAPVVVEFASDNGYPVLQRGWLGNMNCVAQVTR